MRRLQLPKCTGCKVSSAVYESAQFPSVQLCYQCMKRFSDWLLDRSKLEWNPLVDEFANWCSEPKESSLGVHRMTYYGVQHSVIPIKIPK